MMHKSALHPGSHFEIFHLMTTSPYFPFLKQENLETLNTHFGSLDKLYALGLSLVSKEYSIQCFNSGSRTDLANVRKELYDLEDKLDELGFDGHRIMTEINSDFGETVISQNQPLEQLKAWLQRLGLTLDEARKLISK